MARQEWGESGSRTASAEGGFGRGKAVAAVAVADARTGHERAPRLAAERKLRAACGAGGRAHADRTRTGRAAPRVTP
jgi:hypothetical protein